MVRSGGDSGKCDGILMAFSATVVAVFGVYFKLQSFVFMPIFGMNNGITHIQRIILSLCTKHDF